MYVKFIKPVFDFFGACALLLLVLPVMLVVGFVIKMDDGNDIFFTQSRIGKGGVSFKMYKFRSLKQHTKGMTFSTDQITSAGYLLRKYSLDELPQLFNIVKGEMSLVGPRPLPVEYQDKIAKKYVGRNKIKPGLTGFAQIYARNTHDWNEKFDWDLSYLKKASFLSDLVILTKTAIVLINPSSDSAKSNIELSS